MKDFSGKCYQVEAATVRARMLVGRVTLQGNRVRYNQFKKKNDLCRLYREEGTDSPASRTEWCKAILNGGDFVSDGGKTIQVRYPKPFNQICNLLCKDLYVARDILINNEIMMKLND